LTLISKSPIYFHLLGSPSVEEESPENAENWPYITGIMIVPRKIDNIVLS